MALVDVTRRRVECALDEFDRVGRNCMLERYGGGLSTKWYIQARGKPYDQKLILRAAHEHEGLGALPSGRGTFTAGNARRHLKRLGYPVSPGPASSHS